MPTQLLVRFPSNAQWPGWNSPEYLLTNIDLSPSNNTSNNSNGNGIGNGSAKRQSPPQKVITVTVDPFGTHADYLSDASVFRAYPSSSCSDQGSNGHLDTTQAPSASSGPSYALKFAFREDLIASLAAEATVYTNYLHPLQGTVVPKCHGLFLGSPIRPTPQANALSGHNKKEDRDIDDEGDDKGMAACLMLEWWGESVNRPFGMLPAETRLLIVSRLASIHRAGLVHGDFAERNVLIENNTGDVRLIDFDIMARHGGASASSATTECRACETRDFMREGADADEDEEKAGENGLVNGMNGLHLENGKTNGKTNGHGMNGHGAGHANGTTTTKHPRPNTTSNGKPQPPPPPASHRSHSHSQRLQMMYEEESEDEDDGFSSNEGREFGCEQLYEVCKMMGVLGYV